MKAAAGLFAAALLLASTPSSAGNVILLIADDLGVDKVDAYDESPIPSPTPNIDSLASQGVLFRNAWAYPVCSPTRSSMMTGLHPTRHGVGWYVDPGNPLYSTGLDPTVQTLPKRLAAAGVRTAAFGKWHMSTGPFWNAHPNLAGFSHYSGFIWGGVDYYSWPKTVNGATAFTTTYATTDTANDVIASLAGSEPFFLWVGFLAVHTPLQAPPAQLHTQPLAGLPVAGNEVLYHRAMLQALDNEIGRILASVDLSDTTVIFTADNGTNNDAVQPPFVSGRGKFTVYEGGVNVPLIVAGEAVPPGVQGQESNALVQLTDLFATILAMQGASGSARDSISLIPYLQDPGRPSVRQTVYSEGFTPNGGPINPSTHRRTARDARYKLVRIPATGDELYDLVADPFEHSKLPLYALTGEQQAAYQSLDQAIRAIPAAACPGDCNGDGTVGSADFLMMRQQFGNDCVANPGAACTCDSDGDRLVGTADFIALRSSFGSTCAP